MNFLAGPNVSPRDEDEHFDLVTILDVILENRRLIGIVAVAFLTLGVLYAVIAQPIYSTDIMVQVEESPDASAAKSILGDVSSLFDVKSSAPAESQILASRLVVAGAVDHLLLYIEAEPRRLPIIGKWIARGKLTLSQPGLFGYGGYTWGAEQIDVQRFDVPADMEDDRFTLTLLDARHYRLSSSDLDHPVLGEVGRLETIPTSLGNISLLVRSISGEPGAEYRLRRHSRELTIADLQDKLDVDEKVKESGIVIASLQGTDAVETAAILNAIATQYIAQNVERKSAEAEQSLQFLRVKLPQIKKALDAAQTRYTAMRNEHGSVDMTEEAKLSLAQASDAQSRLLELQERRDELVRRFGPAHPAIRTIDAQMASLRTYTDSASAAIKSLPTTQQDLVQVMLDVQVNTDLYTSLLNNYQQLQLVKAGKTGNVRLVDNAAIPEKPIKPKRALVIIGSLLAGLSIGVMLAFVRNMLFRGIGDPNEIERRSGLHVYSTIPLSEKQEVLHRRISAREPGVKVLAIDSPDDPTVESLRSLRTALQFTLFNSKNNIVLVTGPSPSVGKSFITANFATVLTSAGKRVLLIDADLRRGHLHQYFGVKRGVGLSELISSQRSPEEVVRRNVLPNLDFLSTGTVPRNPAELLLSDRLTRVMTELSSQYDIVLVDTAPVLAAADAGIIAPLAGTVFLVARASVTKMGELTESIKLLAQSNVVPTGVLFNALNLKHARYGYGSKYGAYRAYRYVGYGAGAAEK